MNKKFDIAEFFKKENINHFWICEQITKFRTDFETDFFLNFEKIFGKWNILWYSEENFETMIIFWICEFFKMKHFLKFRKTWNHEHFFEILDHFLKRNFFWISEQNFKAWKYGIFHKLWKYMKSRTFYEILEKFQKCKHVLNFWAKFETANMPEHFPICEQYLKK